MIACGKKYCSSYKKTSGKVEDFDIHDIVETGTIKYIVIDDNGQQFI